MSSPPETSRHPGAAAAIVAFVGSALLLAAAVWYFVQRGRTTRFLHGDVGAMWVTHFAATRSLTTLAAGVMVGASALVLRAHRRRALVTALLLLVSAVLAVTALQVSPAHFGNAFQPGLMSLYPSKYGIAALVAVVACASGLSAGLMQIRTRESVRRRQMAGD